MISNRIVRVFIAPVLFSLLYVSHCPSGRDGFILKVKIGQVSVTATSCG
jgi:hypothetical protein